MNWEINNRSKWNDDVVRGPPHAAAIPLSDDKVESRCREFQQLTRGSLALRAFTYFMGCFACQTFWTAVAVFAITRGVSDLVAWLFTAAACSGAAVFTSVVQGWSVPPRGGEPAAGRGGCKDCGK